MKINSFLQCLLAKVNHLKDDSLQMKEVHLWRIISAMRGPDVGDDRLKWLTTARIRHIVFGHNNYSEPDFYNPLYLNVNTHSLDAKERECRDLLLDGIGSGSSPHFREHIRNAYESIRELYGYDLVEEEEVNTPELKMEEEGINK